MSDAELQQMLNRVHCMDCIEFLQMIPDDSMDSCATDPPYGLEFMGKEWDKVGTPREYQDWCMEWAKEVFRVLKPGAHLLAFSGTRTYHRLACAVEDAGFEIRDQIHWLYGSGFPKGLNVSNAIMEKQFKEWLNDHPLEKVELKGLQYPSEEYRQFKMKLMLRARILRETVKRDESFYSKKKAEIEKGQDNRSTFPIPWGYQSIVGSLDILVPATIEARRWMGYNTQLKPSHEPILLARKPVSENSVVENVLKYGTGAINIDVCRIAVSPDVDAIGKTTKRKKRVSPTWEEGSGFKNESNPGTGILPTGRYPANLILSHHPDCKLIRKGKTIITDKSSQDKEPRMGKTGIYGHHHPGIKIRVQYDDEPEVWQCVEGCPVRMLNEQSGARKSGGDVTGNEPSKRKGQSGVYGGEGYGFSSRSSTHNCIADRGGAARFFYCSKPSVEERSAGLSERNVHITVKPIEILRWLVRLVTQKEGIVLDPFLGSGTTAIAAENEGFKWLGCDNNEEYCEIAKARIKALGGERIGRKHDFSGWRRRRKIRESSKSASGVF